MFKYFILFFVLVSTVFVFIEDSHLLEPEKIPQELAAKNIYLQIQNKKKPAKTINIKAEKIFQKKNSYFFSKLYIKEANKQLQASKGIWQENKLLMQNNVLGKCNDIHYSSQKANWDLVKQEIEFIDSFVLKIPQNQTTLKAQKALLQKNNLQATKKVYLKTPDYKLQSENIFFEKKLFFSPSFFQLMSKNLTLTANSFSYLLGSQRLQAQKNVVATHKENQFFSDNLQFLIDKKNILSTQKFMLHNKKKELFISGGSFLYDLTTEILQVKKEVQIKKNTQIMITKNLSFSQKNKILQTQEEFTITDPAQKLKIVGIAFLYDLENQTIQTKKNTKIDLENFFIQGESFFLDFKKGLLTSEQKVQIQDKKNATSFEPKFFTYDISNQLLKIKK